MTSLVLLLALAAAPVRVVLETEAGAIEIEVDVARAPRTAANFLRYVDARRYDGGSFFRTVREDNQREAKVPIAVIQGGVPEAREKDDFAPIALERTRDTGLRHVDGTVSMARNGPDTATSSFFVCVGDQPELDFAGRRNPDGQGFAAFGRVVRGMDVVRTIQTGKATDERLTPPVRITRAARTALARRPSQP
jgi:peptidyl-prolyl cis-trans isomerase A (cyclophilin A)